MTPFRNLSLSSVPPARTRQSSDGIAMWLSLISWDAATACKRIRRSSKSRCVARGSLRQFKAGAGDRRAAVSLIVAATVPVLLGVMALGIDVSYWTTVRLGLQRTADIAALAGAAKYASTDNSSSALTTAANIAELNGLPVGTRTGDGSTTLTDAYGSYSATFGFSNSPAQITVSVSQSVPFIFSALLVSNPSQGKTITATATAQIYARPGGGVACVVALNGSSTGITTYTDLSVSGGNNTNVAMSGCDIRSDASIDFNGNPGVGVPNLIASGSISGSYRNICTTTTGCDQQLTAVPQIPDPLASSYASALSVPVTAIAQPTGTTLSPPPSGEAYQSLSFSSGTYTLSPGTYYVSGSVTFNSNSVVSGTGVTIIMGNNGSLTMNGNATVNLTAPTSGSTAGLLFGSTTPHGITFSGNSASTLGGAIYLPNGSANIGGNTSPASSCLEIVAQNVSFEGSSSFSSSGCGSLGGSQISDYPASAKLVQ